MQTAQSTALGQIIIYHQSSLDSLVKETTTISEAKYFTRYRETANSYPTLMLWTIFRCLVRALLLAIRP